MSRRPPKQETSGKCTACGIWIGDVHTCQVTPVAGHCAHYLDLTPEQCGICVDAQKRNELESDLAAKQRLFEQACEENAAMTNLAADVVQERDRLERAIRRYRDSWYRDAADKDHEKELQTLFDALGDPVAPCKHCQKAPVAYPGAVFCGAACAANAGA